LKKECFEILSLLSMSAVYSFLIKLHYFTTIIISQRLRPVSPNARTN
jgi:hypothetical protein